MGTPTTRSETENCIQLSRLDNQEKQTLDQPATLCLKENSRHKRIFACNSECNCDTPRRKDVEVLFLLWDSLGVRHSSLLLAQQKDNCSGNCSDNKDVRDQGSQGTTFNNDSSADTTFQNKRFGEDGEDQLLSTFAKGEAQEPNIRESTEVRKWAVTDFRAVPKTEQGDNFGQLLDTSAAHH